MPKKKPAAKPRKRPTKAAKPRRRAAASPKPARARKAPQRAAKAPKVPARFRALGGVDPRTLPPGTPYPCSDGYVGAVVRGDKLAGRIVACATPPAGSRGQHFVLGKVASGRAISGEFRKGYKVAEKAAAVQRERARRDSIRTPEGPLPRARRRVPEATGPSFAPRVKQAPVERRSQRVEVAAQPVPARIFRMELLGDDVRKALYYTRPFVVMPDGTSSAIDFYHHRDGQEDSRLACGPGLISEKAYDAVKVMPLLGDDVARELASALASIGVSVRLVDVTGDYAVFATTAPDAYDGMGTVAIKHGFTPADIDEWSRQRYQWRAILVPRRSVEWQTMRNSSGNHPSWPSSLAEVAGLAPVALTQAKLPVVGELEHNYFTQNEARLLARVRDNIPRHLDDSETVYRAFLTMNDRVFGAGVREWINASDLPRGTDKRDREDTKKARALMAWAFDLRSDALNATDAKWARPKPAADIVDRWVRQMYFGRLWTYTDMVRHDIITPSITQARIDLEVVPWVEQLAAATMPYAPQTIVVNGNSVSGFHGFPGSSGLLGKAFGALIATMTSLRETSYNLIVGYDTGARRASFAHLMTWTESLSPIAREMLSRVRDSEYSDRVKKFFEVAYGEALWLRSEDGAAALADARRDEARRIVGANAAARKRARQ